MPRPRKLKEYQREGVIRAWQIHQLIGEIAQTYEVSRGTIAKIIREAEAEGFEKVPGRACSYCRMIFDESEFVEGSGRCHECRALARHHNHVFKTYGISRWKYDAILQAQGGCCAICKRSPGTRRLAVDHCHDTLVNRGLLCFACNAGIGQFKHDPDLLLAAVRYLGRNT